MTTAADMQDLRKAVQDIVDYLADERSHYEREIEDGRSADVHIYHSVRVLENWLETQHIREDLAKNNAINRMYDVHLDIDR